MNRYIPCDEKYIKVNGRTLIANPLPVFWTGAGIEFKINGSELSVDFTTDYDVYEQWIRVEIDGYSAIRTSLPKGKSNLRIYANMNPENVRHVKIIREVQAMSGDASNLLLIDGVNSDGQLFPLEDKKYRFEFVGDSITSGEGLCGPQSMCEWNSFVFSTVNHYTMGVCKKLNADLRIVSQSGWGTYCGWNNDMKAAIPPAYEYVCGLQQGAKQVALGSLNKNDFDGYKADVVFINLGTNDLSAFNNPEWTDPDTGIKYKQIKNADGSFEDKSVKNFTDAAVSFLKCIRKNNPTSRILWMYGMIGCDFEPVILQAIEEYKTSSADERVDYLRLPDTTEDGFGANWHPGVKSHQAAGDTIVDFLKERYNFT